MKGSLKFVSIRCLKKVDSINFEAYCKFNFIFMYNTWKMANNELILHTTYKGMVSISGGPRDAHAARPQGGGPDADAGAGFLAGRARAEGRRRRPARAAAAARAPRPAPRAPRPRVYTDAASLRMRRPTVTHNRSIHNSCRE